MLKFEKNKLEKMKYNSKSRNTDIEYIKARNAKMTPFSSDDNIKWYRIKPFELTALGDNSWKYINNQFVYSSYKKYKHLMLGIEEKQDKEKYILAVPCRFSSDFNQNLNTDDFNQFMFVDKDSNDYGYRILYIKD